MAYKDTNPWIKPKVYDEHGNRVWPEGFNPKVIENLKPLTSEVARERQKKSVEVRKMNTEMRESFKKTAEQFAQVMEEAKIDPLTVMKMAVMQALERGDYDGAARIAKDIAPYTSAKLSSSETKSTVLTKDLSDEELELEIKKLEESSGKPE